MINPILSSIQMVNWIKQNPSEALKQAGINIPAGMNDPQQILQHMLNGNQALQQKYQQVLNMLGRH